MTLGITLLGGAWIFGAVIVALTFAVIFGLYTRGGSGISQRPYNRRYGDAPGAKGQSTISGRDGLARMTSRGTK
jgi:hypothetical protein